MIVFCCVLPASNKARDVMMMMMLEELTSLLESETSSWNYGVELQEREEEGR